MNQYHKDLESNGASNDGSIILLPILQVGTKFIVASSTLNEYVVSIGGSINLRMKFSLPSMFEKFKLIPHTNYGPSSKEYCERKNIFTSRSSDIWKLLLDSYKCKWNHEVTGKYKNMEVECITYGSLLSFNALNYSYFIFLLIIIFFHEWSKFYHILVTLNYSEIFWPGLGQIFVARVRSAILGYS